MIRDFFLWLLTMFVIEPFQAEWTNRLSQLGAPPAIVAELGRCATAAGPALANRAADDPWWGISTAAGVALGLRDGLAVVTEATPTCAAAVASARPFLSGRAT